MTRRAREPHEPIRRRKIFILADSRGHAAKRFPFLFVIAPAVTTRYVRPTDVGLATAVTNAAEPSTAYSIGNVSGYVAIPMQDGSNGAWSTKRIVTRRASVDLRANPAPIRCSGQDT